MAKHVRGFLSAAVLLVCYSSDAFEGGTAAAAAAAASEIDGAVAAFKGSTAAASSDNKWNGLCFASWASHGADSYDSTSSDASIVLAAASGINSMAIVQTWFMQNQNDTSIAASPTKTNTESGLRRAMGEARAKGLKVVLKPHVDFTEDDAHWRGEIGPQFTLADWEAWFSSYSAYMLSMASLAVSENVDLFVVGTELSTTESQEYLWRKLIAEIRNITDTAPTKISLSYGANWSPGPDNVRFWDAVDYIGVDAYYPLAKTAGSTVEELVDSWGSTSKPGSILADIKNLSNAYNNKPVLFLELGYTSTAACAVGNHAGGVRNLQAQADAYTAFFKAVYQQPWFAGVFFWDWETNPNGGGRCDGGGDSFTPQGKPAEYVMRTYFNGGNASALGQSTHLRGPTPEVVFSNGKLAHRWKDYSYNGETKLESPDDPFTGNTYSAFGSYTNWGAMAFFANHGIKVTRSGAAEPNGTSFSRVCFALKPTNTSGGETQLALYGSSDESNPFSPLFVSHYTPNCTVPTGGEWIQICVPLIDLLPPLEPPGPQPPSCSDTPPPTSPQYTCAQQQSWGKCDATTNPWMTGYCCKTCFQCAPGCGKLDGDKRSSSARETAGGGDDDSYTIVKVAFKANYATGVGAFGLDEVKFE